MESFFAGNPSACRANIPRCLTAYVSLDNESNGITVPRVSLQSKNCKLWMSILLDRGASSLNATEVLFLHTKLKIIQEHSVQANKTALEVEKARDDLHNQFKGMMSCFSPYNGIMSCFSFLFLSVSRHYTRRSYCCWCKACSHVRGRGHGSKSCGANLVVQGCTCTKQTFWTEDQFVVTSSSEIRDHDTRVAEIVSGELQKTKPNINSKMKVAGSMSCVEKELILGPRKFEEYKGSRFYNRDCTLVVDV